MSKIRTVLIDEFQGTLSPASLAVKDGADSECADTNNVQFALVKAMAKAHGSLTIVGDPDQSSVYHVVVTLRSFSTADTPLASLRLALCRGRKPRTDVSRSVRPFFPPLLASSSSELVNVRLQTRHANLSRAKLPLNGCDPRRRDRCRLSRSSFLSHLSIPFLLKFSWAQTPSESKSL